MAPLDLIKAAIGLVMLMSCADFLVRGAVNLAQRLGLSTLIIGLTVVAFGTSAPEFVAALTAALRGVPEMAVGNVVGSNIANLLLVLGVAAVIRPIACSPRAIRRDGMAMVFGTLLFIVIGLTNGIVAWQGTLMLVIFISYLWASFRAERALAGNVSVHVQEAQAVVQTSMRLPVAIAMVAASLAGIILGAHLLVNGGTGIARALGVSEAVIGLTLIAIGTSLPELATVGMASIRGQGDVAVGNILGSNIFNLLAVGGGIAIIRPLPVPDQIAHFDVWVMLAATLSLIAVTAIFSRIPRIPAALMLTVYVAYIVLQFGPARSVLGLS